MRWRLSNKHIMKVDSLHILLKSISRRRRVGWQHINKNVRAHYHIDVSLFGDPSLGDDLQVISAHCGLLPTCHRIGGTSPFR